MKLVFSFLFSILFISSCGTKKSISNLTNDNDSAEDVALINAYTSNVLSFDQLQYTASMQYAGGGMELGFNGVFRMKKDELIWGSFKKFGFEAVRLKITPDTMWVLNRLQKEVIVEPMSRIEKMTGVPLTFQDVEQILLGGSFFTDKVVMVNDSTLTQSQSVNGTLVEAIHVFNDKMEIVKSDVDAQEQGNLHIDYDAHRLVNETKLAFIRNIIAQSGAMNVNLGIQTQNIDVGAIFETPFDIPANYTRKSF